MRISAVMIVKNESVCLSKCLDSIKDFVDEIVILDTGSIDNTIKIAEKYTDEVYQWKWEDDFSKARNQALEFATWDIILSIDADEVLVLSASKKDIIEYIQKNTWWYDKVWWANVLMDNWYWATNKFARIFWQWTKRVWKIHEYPLFWEAPFDISDMVKIVYGRSPAHDLDPDLDFRILESEYFSWKASHRDVFYYWRELYYKKLYNTAIDVLMEYIKSNDTFYEQRTEAFYIIALCYWESGMWDSARDACAIAITRNPHMRKAIKQMADMCYEREKKRWLQFLEWADNTWVLFT